MEPSSDEKEIKMDMIVQVNKIAIKQDSMYCCNSYTYSVYENTVDCPGQKLMTVLDKGKCSNECGPKPWELEFQNTDGIGVSRLLLEGTNSTWQKSHHELVICDPKEDYIAGDITMEWPCCCSKMIVQMAPFQGIHKSSCFKTIFWLLMLLALGLVVGVPLAVIYGNKTSKIVVPIIFSSLIVILIFFTICGRVTRFCGQSRWEILEVINPTTGQVVAIVYKIVYSFWKRNPELYDFEIELVGKHNSRELMILIGATLRMRWMIHMAEI